MKLHSSHKKHKAMPTENKYLILTLTEDNISEDLQGYEDADLQEDDKVIVVPFEPQLTVVITGQILEDNPELDRLGLREGDELQLVAPLNLSSTEHPIKPPVHP